MKFLALAALLTTSAFARVRDRNNGEIGLNEFCPKRGQIIKSHRCGPGLECENNSCKAVEGTTCISENDCYGDLKCWSTKVCKKGVEVTTTKKTTTTTTKTTTTSKAAVATAASLVKKPTPPPKKPAPKKLAPPSYLSRKSPGIPNAACKATADCMPGLICMANKKCGTMPTNFAQPPVYLVAAQPAPVTPPVTPPVQQLTPAPVAAPPAYASPAVAPPAYATPAVAPPAYATAAVAPPAYATPVDAAPIANVVSETTTTTAPYATQSEPCEETATAAVDSTYSNVASDQTYSNVADDQTYASDDSIKTY